MLRIPVLGKMQHRKAMVRANSSSSYIRESFIKYFVENHDHKFVKSSSVVPLSDPTVPFVNAGMNQFKGVFLGTVEPPHPRVVNSQKCIRVGGKHNDLDVVGTDGHHHTFFEMLGNWSFGDYYKEEACKMSWELLTGPFQLNSEKLLVTYFGGDPVIGLVEDRECRDAWRKIGIPSSRLRAQNASENFWEMGDTGPCGPCTEIHYINDDGSLTELWNIVFIHCNRDENGKVVGLHSKHVDTGMGLERMTALLQGVPSNYDTDLFLPLIRSIEKNSKGVDHYKSRYGENAGLDVEYRRLADHARMISVCLADGAFPSSSLNLKQIMRKSFKMCTDVFQNPQLMPELYNMVMDSLGPTYPELVTKEIQAKRVLEYEAEAYKRLRSDMQKKWKNLVKQYPEVESLKDVELAGFSLGYTEFKNAIAKLKTKVIPGDVVFKLYDTHGFHETLIEKIAKLNKMEIDREGFWKRLTQHKSRHKTALREFSSHNGKKYNEAIEKLKDRGLNFTNDLPKYNYKVYDKTIQFNPLNTEVVAILNEDLEWIDFLDPTEGVPFCIVTKDTNFYSEEGGQICDTGKIVINKNVVFNVESAYKIRDFVFHKGYFLLDNKSECHYVNNKWSSAELQIDSVKRIKTMKNHTAVHLLNAAVRQVLQNSGICQIGSGVSDKGLHLTLAIYGAKLSQESITQIQELIWEAIKADVPVSTQVLTRHELSEESCVTTVPGEHYPETGLRLVSSEGPVTTKELCCGSHVPSTGFLEDFCITHVKGANSNSPTIYALSGDAAKEVHELYCRAQKLEQVCDLLAPERKSEEIETMKEALSILCVGSGAPAGIYANCLALLQNVQRRQPACTDMELQAVAEQEILAAAAEAEERRVVVHFLRCSYLMHHDALQRVLHTTPSLEAPAMIIGCAGGVILAACRVPKSMVTESFTAERWLSCILPVFQARIEDEPLTDDYAQMTATKVSLITCEQQVQDAMQAAVKFAQAHVKDKQEPPHDLSSHGDTEGIRQN